MAVKRIGIIGQHNDADAQLLKAKIEDRGGEARIIDLTLFPSVVQGSITLDSLMYDGMNLLDFDGFYIRKLAAAWNLPMKEFSQQQWVNLYGEFNDYMDNVRAGHSYKISLARILSEEKLVVNPYPSWTYHHLKLLQYWILTEKGFKVPKLFAGNNYFDLKRFVESGDTVKKPMVTGAVQLVDAKSLESNRSDLRESPIVCQEFIKGKSLRAFVLGDEVIAACELPHKEQGVDASEHIEHMKSIHLPADVQREVVRAAKTLEMIFSGVDLQYEESSGEYYFLECNNAPYFRPYDTMVDADIGGKLAAYLLEKS